MFAIVSVIATAAVLFWTTISAQEVQGVQIVKGTIKIYGNDSYPVIYRKNQPIDSPRARYTGFKPFSYHLKKGTVRRAGAKPLPCDIIFERDVAVKLRDGITIYTDVFRPVGGEKAPGIIAWGPYGKEVSADERPAIFTSNTGRLVASILMVR
jgi:uncharacterized protein